MSRKRPLRCRSETSSYRLFACMFQTSERGCLVGLEPQRTISVHYEIHCVLDVILFSYSGRIRSFIKTRNKLNFGVQLNGKVCGMQILDKQAFVVCYSRMLQVHRIVTVVNKQKYVTAVGRIFLVDDLIM